MVLSHWTCTSSYYSVMLNQDSAQTSDILCYDVSMLVAAAAASGVGAVLTERSFHRVRLTALPSR
jgi:hypothetical protein